MFHAKQVVNLDKDPLADRGGRTAIIMAESEYTDWVGSARYNVVCLTRDFEEYESHPHTRVLDKNKHTKVGSLRDHSIICPWATLAIPGDSLTHVTTNSMRRQKIELTDEGHELAAQTIYKFFSSQNNY